MNAVPGASLAKIGPPLHQQLFVVLRDQILRGLYEPGAAIPNEQQLGKIFGVSRITVRRAVANLENEGLVEKQQGRGTFVREVLPAQRPAATLGFLESLRKHAPSTQVKVVDVKIGNPPPVVAVQLQLSPGDRAVHAVRVRSMQGAPVMVTEAWIPESFGHNITRSNLKSQTLYEIMVAQGVRFGRVVQEITAVPADPVHGKLLSASVGAPLLRMHRLLYATDKKPVQHLTIYVSPERSRILMDVGIESLDTLAAGQITHDAQWSASGN
jgi:GntR family transcriptional regulator